MLKKTLAIIVSTIFLILLTGNSFSSLAQEVSQWSPQQNIPGYHPETWPPILIADRNRTVHAFSYQWIGEDIGKNVREVVYNQWTPEQGWTVPVDILISPNKNDARLTDAYLDQDGMMHVLFWGGDNTDAKIYYSRAPGIDAGKVSAWSSPMMVAENAAEPHGAVFYTVDSNHLGILYNGSPEGFGVYEINSFDDGETWSQPVLISNSSSYYLVQRLQDYKGQSGAVHAIWNDITPGGQGRRIQYARWQPGELMWSDPIKLTEVESGLGTQYPAIIEHKGVVFAFYYLNGRIVMNRSSDGGVSWSEPEPLFIRHVGVNGPFSPVIDGNDDLHLFFGQRISASGFRDIHGMWHSIWQGSRWSEPEAVVSGPQVRDDLGDKSFDPNSAQAIVSQGDLLLVTWRTDPGLKGNGVWYSFKELESGELPIEPLPTSVVTPTPQPFAESIIPTSTVSSNNRDLLANLNTELTNTSLTSRSNRYLWIGLGPVVLLISLVVIRFIFFPRKPR